MSTPIGEGYEAERNKTREEVISAEVETIVTSPHPPQRDVVELHLAGRGTDHIWTMEDGPESHPIGIRMDCGDSGVVYISREQAVELAFQLQQFVGGSVAEAALRNAIAETDMLLNRAKGEPAHSPTEDALIDALESLTEAVKLLASK